MTQEDRDEERKAQTRAAHRRYRAANREDLNAKRRALRAANPERKRASERAYRAANREDFNAKQRAYRARCPHTYREAKRARAQKNYSKYRARLLAYQRRYYAMNGPKVRQRVARWQQAHPDHVTVYRHRRRAWLVQAPLNDLTPAQWRAIKTQYKYRCVYCGKKSQRLTQDHLTPLSKGGGTLRQTLSRPVAHVTARKAQAVC